MDMDQIWDLFRMVSRDTQANVASSSRAPNLAASSSATPPARVQKINDHVYEVSNLSGLRPSLELIFFHGLQLEGSQEPHLETWFSRDGNNLWLMWILDHFPDARILTVSYDAHEKMTDEGGRNDMLADMDTLFIKGQLFQDATTLNKEVARRNEDFRRLCTNHRWKTFAIGENHPMSMGRFKGLFVPEASARHHMDGFYTVDGNHKTVCRPESPSSSNYSILLGFVTGIMEEVTVFVHECQGLPSYLIGLDSRTWDVQKILEGGAILGICGMGGIGKTTLAKKIFNTISKDFEYTCFVDNVKGIDVLNLNETILEHFHQNGMKLDKALAQWSQLKDKKILLVMDDVDLEEQLKISPTWNYFKNGSCLIMTSRDREVFKFYGDCSIYEVELLQANEAEELFSKHVFGLDPIPNILRKYVMAVVEKCNGLPLTLEVIGRYLRGRTTKVGVWEEIMDKLGKATPLHGNDRVWALLKVSYDGLSKEEQAIFIEAAMIFFERPLDHALMAWGNAETTWENLVSRSLAKEIIEEYCDPILTIPPITCKIIWVHEHLRDLAKSIANDNMVLHGYGQDLSPVVNTLSANEVPAMTINLRRQSVWDPFTVSTEARSTLQLDSLLRLKKLKYLEMHHVNIEGRRRFLKLRFSPIKIKMDNLVVLQLSQCEIPNVFVEALGNLTNLRMLSLVELGGFQRLPKNFGNLTQLRRLIIQGCQEIKCLPQNFSELSRLEELFIHFCGNLEELGDSFGHLTSLRKLILWNVGIQRLPANFDHLSALEDLTLQSVSKLKSLSVDFGQLTALKDLFIDAEELETLPENFHFPKSLEQVRLFCVKLERLLPENLYFLKSLQLLILSCPKLTSLPDDFGQLTALKDLSIEAEELETLPENFHFPESLQGLSLACPKLKSLSVDFGQLTALKNLSIAATELETLPENIHFPKSLQELSLVCPKMKSLSDDFGQLTALKDLVIRNEALETLPENFFFLKSLQKLSLTCGILERLPESLGLVTSLREVRLENCRSLKSVPDSLGKPSSPQPGWLQGHETDEFRRRAGECSQTKPTEGVRLIVHGCPYLSDSVLGFCGWGKVPLASYFKRHAWVVHNRVKCDDCGMFPLEGQRYKSSIRFDYDLCHSCFQRSGSDASEYTCIERPVIPTYHPCRRCDECGMYPPEGPRHKSSTKFDYVLCPDCFQKSGSNASEYTSVDPPIFHLDTECNGCGMNPLEGPRYRSCTRFDYDLCHGCFVESGSKASEYICIDRP